MADTDTAVLLIDFDSVRRSLESGEPGSGQLLASRAADWLSAMEDGRLVEPSTKRRILVRRCYADPDMIGPGSADLAAAGFDMVETHEQPGNGSSALLHMAIDALDALNDEVKYGEIIILSADGDLDPLLKRVRAANRKTVTFAPGQAGEAQGDASGALLSSDSMAKFLAGDAADRPALKREQIENFARRMSTATNLPLLSPKTYAEMFRHLAEEIATNGYDFQTTARHVADRLGESGRKVARRQVVFVVKGLALKGHVFSTSDTSRRLAEVFREQAHYLIGNTGVTLDSGDERLLTAWLVGRTPEPQTAGEAVASKPTKPAAAKSAATPEPVSAVEPPTAAAKPKKKQASKEKPAATEEPPLESRPVEPAGSEPVDGTDTGTNPDEPGEQTPTSERPKIRSGEEVKAEIAARIADSVRERKARDGSAPGTAKPTRKKRKKQPSKKTPADDGSRAEGNSEELESSILAAIAEAVDVLVEGGTPEDEQKPGGSGSDEKSRDLPLSPTPEPVPSEGSAGDDIGDEIQRIIASYGREKRTQEDG